MDLHYSLIIDWSAFPESFCERFEKEIARTDAEDSGVVCEIHFNYTPYCPGRYDGKPENCYPAEEAEVEIEATLITVYHQRALPTDPVRRPGWLCAGRFYHDPRGGYTMAHDHLQPFDPTFLEIAHSFAQDWLAVNEERVMELLLEEGARVHKDEISEILADIETDIASGFLGREKAVADLATWMQKGAAANYEADRKKGGDQ